LINKSSGSFFFIAEIILDVTLNYDTAIKDYCGTCTKCIDACPTDAIVEPLSDDSHITVMAVDNLPCELPRSASDEFGRDLIDRIMKPLLVEDTEGIIARATMAENGRLTSNFSYLQDYVDQK
jgi:ferredoxin